MSLRSFIPSLLLLAVAASATAQTAPAKKTTKARSTTMQSRATAKPKPMPGGRNDIGPGGNGAVGSAESADGKGQSVYAAPGMPVNVDNPKKVEGYNGPARTKPRTGTTLTPR